MKKVILSSILILLVQTKAFAVPVTMYFEGSVVSWGVDSLFSSPAVAVNDPLTGFIMYDSNATVTYTDSSQNYYGNNGILGLNITFQTSSGPVTYAADNTVNAQVVTGITVKNDQISYRVTDFDRNNTNPPVTGPNEPGEYPAGNSVTFVPVSIAWDMWGDFSSFRSTQTLPIESTFPALTYVEPAVLFQAQYTSNSYVQGWYRGSGEVAQSQSPPPVPEPTSMLLLGFGLIGLAGFRRKLKKS